MDYLLPDKVYDALKWTAIVLLPVIGWAIGALIGASQIKSKIKASDE